jgi:MinD superfamily P-loop ATPase
MGEAAGSTQVIELLVISGKGGTGKTSIMGAFAALAPRAVLADCDVDAANLHLLLKPEVQREFTFDGLPKARILPEKCTQCGICVEACRFDAIGNWQVDPLACEGCGVCIRLCPAEAMESVERVAGRWFVSRTAYGPLVHAELGVGEENSGRLVAEVKRQAREVAQENGTPLILVDGPPGIGCPVISALAGATLALLVTEPSVSGWHDLERALRLARHFGVEPLVCINKADLDEARSREIEWCCYDEGVAVIGHIPFDEKVAEAVVGGVPVTAMPGKAATAIHRLWDKVAAKLAAKGVG